MELLKNLPDLETPNMFATYSRVHDWRNYVPVEFKIEWYNLTLRERQIIYVLCEIQAQNEEWD